MQASAIRVTRGGLEPSAVQLSRKEPDPKMVPNPEMIPKSTPKWSPFLFTSTRKWSPINSWNGMVFRHGIVTGLLQRLHSWIAFYISLQSMWFFFVLLSSGRPFCLLLHIQHHFNIFKKCENTIFKIQYPRHAVLTSFLEVNITSMPFSL